MKITRALTGQYVTFHGYDGRDYRAHVDRVNRRIATISYPRSYLGGSGGETVVAYISDPARLTTIQQTGDTNR